MEERKMEMVLPRNHVEIEQEEMMYLDGGASTTHHWWGMSTTMSKTESVNLQYYLSQATKFGYGGSTIAGGIAGILAISVTGIGAIVAGAIGIIGVSYSVFYDMMENSLNKHTTSRGVVLNISRVSIFWSTGR